ncbi:MAG: hypothetical protein U0228_26285 [Myxococcaceae bacterium]
MLAIALAVLLAQASPDAEPTGTGTLTPPPPPPASVDTPVAAPQDEPRGRSAKLLPTKKGREPRVEGGTLVGRAAMSLLTGTLGYGVGAGITIGAGFIGVAIGGGSYAAIIFVPIAIAIASPLILAAVVFGTALGAAMFGENYGRDFADALKTAAWVLPASGGVAGLLSLLLFAIPSPVVVFIPFLALVAGVVSVPLFVQAFKPEPEELVLRSVDPRWINDNAPRGGVTFAF